MAAFHLGTASGELLTCFEDEQTRIYCFDLTQVWPAIGRNSTC